MRQVASIPMFRGHNNRLLRVAAFPLLAASLLFSSCATPVTPPQDGIADALATLEKSSAPLVRTVLDNGMICLFKEDRAAPVAAIQIWIRTGSVHEQEYLGSGLSHAIEHMIFKGTDKRGPGDVMKDINNAGGDINAYTSLDRTVFHTDLPARNWKIGLEVLADALMNSTFPEEEWKKEKDVILREIAMNRDDPGRVVDKLLMATAFSTHPYRYPVIGYEEIFKQLTHKDLIQFERRSYVPDNMIVVVVGDIPVAEMKDAVKSAFAGLDRRARAPVLLPQEPLQISPRSIRQSGSYKISRMELSYHTVPLHHTDVAALDLLAQLAGSGRTSRLTSEIKENRKLAHGIGAASYTLREAGVFQISATFDPAKEKELIAAILAEIDGWATASFSANEISKVRNMIMTDSLSELQTMRGQAVSYATGEFYAHNARLSETYLKNISRVTAEELRAVARKYLRPENSTIALLVPEDGSSNAPAAAADAVISKTPVKLALRSGIPLLVREDHRLPFVYVCAASLGGLLSEDESNCGITRLMSGMLVRGTQERSREEIALAVESQGGSLEPYSGYNGFGLQAKCLAKDAGTFMELLADCLMNPSFPDAELAKLKTTQLANIDELHERPSFLAQESLRAILFPGHPYRFDPLGTGDSVAKITRADLAAFHAKHLGSGNLVLAIFGDITPARALALAEERLAALPAGVAPALESKRPVPQLPARTKRREPKEQAIIMAGFPGVDVKDPRADALSMLDTAMSGLSSELGNSVREKRGLAYFVGAYQQVGLQPGAFIIYAGTREDSIQKVEDLFVEEVNRVTTTGLTNEEMSRARNQIIADFEMGLQDNMGLAMRCALDELYGLGYMHAFTVRERFEAITNEDVRRAAASVLSTNKIVISTLLPEVKDEAQSASQAVPAE